MSGKALTEWITAGEQTYLLRQGMKYSDHLSPTEHTIQSTTHSQLKFIFLGQALRK